MADYISREELLKFPVRADHYDKEHGNYHFIAGIETVLEYAESLPSADVSPTAHGYWEAIDSSYWRWAPSGGVREHHTIFRCGNCGCASVIESRYCPHCGTKMEVDHD